MLILPIVNKNRILNVQITLKGAEKIKTRVSYENTYSSDIIVNGKKLSESQYTSSCDDKTALHFIRSNSLLYPRKYIVTTKEENDSDLYDVYEVLPPPRRVNDGLDNLYGRVLTDMRMESPRTNKGKYLSFEKIGLGESLTDEKIMKLQRIVTEVKDTSKWPELFDREGISDLLDTIHFIKNFDCTVVSDTTIPESSLQDTLKGLEVLHTRDYKNLKNYYNMAMENRDIYAKLSVISKMVYNEPLNLIQSNSQKQRQFIKQKEEMEAHAA